MACKTTSSEELQAPLVTVHRRVTGAPNGIVTELVGLVGVAMLAFPTTTVHNPVCVPVSGLPASVKVLVHKVWSGPELAKGVVVTLTVWLVLAVQLFASVTVTEYVVFTEGVTVIKAVVEPLLHLYVLPPVAVKVVLVPLQILVVPVMLATGKGLTVTT